MKITPLDIRQKRFGSGFRGLDRREVEGYLDLLATDLEEVLKENIGLKEELKRLTAQIEQYAAREHTLQETMLTAQKISEDMKANAKKEAEILLVDAEHQAERIVQGAQQRMVSLMDDLAELKRQKVQFAAQVRGVIDAHQKLLETFTSDDAHPEASVAFLAAKRAQAE